LTWFNNSKEGGYAEGREGCIALSVRSFAFLGEGRVLPGVRHIFAPAFACVSTMDVRLLVPATFVDEDEQEASMGADFIRITSDDFSVTWRRVCADLGFLEMMIPLRQCFFWDRGACERRTAG
jgi:hypothetical protein